MAFWYKVSNQYKKYVLNVGIWPLTLLNIKPQSYTVILMVNQTWSALKTPHLRPYIFRERAVQQSLPRATKSRHICLAIDTASPLSK